MVRRAVSVSSLLFENITDPGGSMLATFDARLGLSVGLVASMLARPTQEHDFHNLIHVGLLRLGFLASLRAVIFVHWSPAKLSM